MSNNIFDNPLQDAASKINNNLEDIAEKKAVDFLNSKYRGKLVDKKETLELSKQLLKDFYINIKQ